METIQVSAMGMSDQRARVDAALEAAASVAVPAYQFHRGDPESVDVPGLGRLRCYARASSLTVMTVNASETWDDDNGPRPDEYVTINRVQYRYHGVVRWNPVTGAVTSDRNQFGNLSPVGSFGSGTPAAERKASELLEAWANDGNRALNIMQTDGFHNTQADTLHNLSGLAGELAAALVDTLRMMGDALDAMPSTPGAFRQYPYDLKKRDV